MKLALKTVVVKAVVMLSVMGLMVIAAPATVRAQNAIEKAVDATIDRLTAAGRGTYTLTISGRSVTGANAQINGLRIAWNKGRSVFSVDRLELEEVTVDGERLVTMAGVTGSRLRLSLHTGSLRTIITAPALQGKGIALGSVHEALGALSDGSSMPRLVSALLANLKADSLVAANLSVELSQAGGVDSRGQIATLGLARMNGGKADLVMQDGRWEADMAKLMGPNPAMTKLDLNYQIERIAYRQMNLVALADYMEAYFAFVGEQLAQAPASTESEALMLLKYNVDFIEDSARLIKNLSYGRGEARNINFRMVMGMPDGGSITTSGGLGSYTEEGLENGVSKGFAANNLAMDMTGDGPQIERLAGRFRVAKMEGADFDIHGYMIRMAHMTAFFARLSGVSASVSTPVQGKLLGKFAMAGVEYDLVVTPAAGAGGPVGNVEMRGGLDAFIIAGLGQGMAERIAMQNVAFSTNVKGAAPGGGGDLFDGNFKIELSDINRFRYGPLLDTVVMAMQRGLSPAGGSGLTLADIQARPLDPSAITSFARRTVLKGMSLNVSLPEWIMAMAMEGDMGLSPDDAKADGKGAFRLVVQIPGGHDVPPEMKVVLGEDKKVDALMRHEMAATIANRHLKETVTMTAADLMNLTLRLDVSGVEYFWRSLDFALLNEAEMTKAMMSPLGFGMAMLHALEIELEDTGLLDRLIPFLAAKRGLSADEIIDAWVAQAADDAQAMYPGDSLIAEVKAKVEAFLRRKGRLVISFKPDQPVPLIGTVIAAQGQPPAAFGPRLGFGIFHIPQ